MRPYNQALTQFTGKICSELGLGDSDVCLFETRVAFDCVLRNKVQKMGAVTDNIGLCSSHINTMKANLGKETANKDFGKLLDGYLEEVHFMRKSFV